MKNVYSLYDAHTGLFTGAVLRVSARNLADNVPDGCGCILGEYDPLSQRVDTETGAVVDYVPPQPSDRHQWDAVDRRWMYVPSLADLQAQTWEQIKAERDRRKAGGVLVGGQWFHSDDASRIQQLGLKDQARDAMTAGGTADTVLQKLGTEILWKTLGGDRVPMTVQLAFDIVEAIGNLDAILFMTAEQHRAAMVDSEDPANYDFLSGWQPTYAEAQAGEGT